jgi:hypothetical protein
MATSEPLSAAHFLGSFQGQHFANTRLDKALMPLLFIRKISVQIPVVTPSLLAEVSRFRYLSQDNAGSVNYLEIDQFTHTTTP